MSEVSFQFQVGSHPYIVNIIGCVTVKPPICLLVEYVPNGDLQVRFTLIDFEIVRPNFQGPSIGRLSISSHAAFNSLTTIH